MFMVPFHVKNKNTRLTILPGGRRKYLQPERFAKTVSLAIDELKAKKAEVVLSVPREWVVMKRLNFHLPLRRILYLLSLMNLIALPP